jgi:hypothetical protein
MTRFPTTTLFRVEVLLSSIFTVFVRILLVLRSLVHASSPVLSLPRWIYEEPV